MGVLIIKSESEIFAIFLLYVFYDTKPAAFNVHEMMWFGVCLCAPHLQLQEEAKPYLYKDDQKRPMPVCKQLSLN